MNNFIYENTWQENKEAMATKKVAIIPVGSLEQHGPALPVGTDWMIAEHFGRTVGEKSDKVMVAAAVPYGHALYHNDFEGTMAVCTPTLVTYVSELCEQLIKYGFTHILFLNAHGGNNYALFMIGQNLRLRGIPVANIQWYEVAGTMKKEWGLRGHGDITETALMLHIAPHAVRLDAAIIPENRVYGNMKTLDLTRVEFENAPVYFNLRTMDVCKDGAIMEYGHTAGVDYSTHPGEATAEMGKEISDAVTDYICRFVDEFVQFSF